MDIPSRAHKHKDTSTVTKIHNIQTHKLTNTQTHIQTHSEYTVFAFINNIIVPENTVILAKLNRKDNSNHTCL